MYNIEHMSVGYIYTKFLKHSKKNENFETFKKNFRVTNKII